MDNAFGVVSKKSMPNPRSLWFFSYIFLKNVVVCGFTFKYMVNSELFFVCSLNYGLRFLVFFSNEFSLFQHYFLKWTILSPLSCSGSFFKNQLNTYILGSLCSVLSIYFSILMSVSHSLEFCSFVICLKIR